MLSTACDRRSIFCVKQLSIKAQCYFLESLKFTSFKKRYFNFHTLLKAWKMQNINNHVYRI